MTKTERTYPVIETFGPTIQGEGALAGMPTLFVRFGGCDYRCSWCDSMYAVDPAEVRENARKLTGEQIVAELFTWIPPGGVGGLWVTLSGGNPALMDFDRRPLEYNFVRALQRHGFRVAVETQGSVWRNWLNQVDHLTVSPKPPSSGMVNDRHAEQTAHFFTQAVAQVPAEHRSLKIVVFNDDDYDWACDFLARANLDPDAKWQTFLSAGTDQDHLQDEYRLHAGIAERYRWLCERVANDPALRDTRVLPQLHVIAFGPARGV